MTFQPDMTESAQLCGAGGEPVVLRSVKATGRLFGLVLSMKLEQVFRNDQADNLEVTYTFPLPWGAVLTGLEVELSGQRLRAQVHAREDAREQYETAIEQGDAPVMVEKSQKGLFTASLGSLKPGEEAVVEISYAQLLSFEQGRVRLVVPTTIAPRYGSAQEQGGLLPHQAAQPDSMVEQAFGLELFLSGPVAAAHISCPTHPVALRRGPGQPLDQAGTENEPGDEVRIELMGSHWLDRDFVLLMDGLQGQTLAVAGADAVSGSGHQALILSACPRLPAAGSAPLAVKILVDCSGSMEGDSMEQARKAVRALAMALHEEDRFTYSRFGTEVQRVLASTQADAIGVKRLVRACNQTTADLGGTEIHQAMEDTFALDLSGKPVQSVQPGRASSQDAGRASDILLITDGDVWDVQNLIDQAASSHHRVYAIGVGSAPAESLLREMAESSGGAAEFVTPGEDMVHAVHRMLRRMRSVKAVSARLTAQTPPLWCSTLPQRLHDDETVHVHLRFDRPLAASPALEIEGMESDGLQRGYAPVTHVPGDLVARLVAARQMATLRTASDVQALALPYQLVSDHTNLLLIHERAEAEKTDGMPALHKVRPMLAAGWGGYGSAGGQGSVSPMMSSSAMMSGLGIPSVWRTRSSTPDAHVMRSIPMDALEIPAFLRCQDSASSGVSADAQKHSGKAFGDGVVEPNSEEEEVIPRLSREWLERWGSRIIKIFNRSLEEGLSFRQVLQSLLIYRIGRDVTVLLYEVGRLVGGSQAAWACFLLWLHDRASGEYALSEAALNLVRDKVGKLTDDQRSAAARRFDEAECNAQV